LLEDGAAYSGAVEVSPEDFVRVKVRYKLPGASETDPASEVAATLAPSALEQSLDDAGSDLQWAVAVATFAELVKASPFADLDAVPALELILSAQASQGDDRAEFATLVAGVEDLLESQQGP